MTINSNRVESKQRFSDKAHLSPAASGGAVGFPSSAPCDRCAGRGAPPAGGDTAFGATSELSAGSSHWAHKSFPAERHGGNVSCCVAQQSPFRRKKPQTQPWTLYLPPASSGRLVADIVLKGFCAGRVMIITYNLRNKWTLNAAWHRL